MVHIVLFVVHVVLFVVHVVLFPVINILYFHSGTFQSTSMCTVPNAAVVCSSLESYFPALFVRNFVNDFEMAPVAPIITGITSVCTFHIHCIVRFCYFKIFSASFTITFLPTANTVSINRRVPFSILQIMMIFIVGGGSDSFHMLIP